VFTLLAGAGLLGSGSVCLAVEISGSARVYGGTTTTEDGDSEDQDLLNQLYQFNATQVLFPYLRLELTYRGTRFDNDTADLELFRKTQEPSIRLTYGPPQFTAVLQHSVRENRATNELQDVDITSSQATMSWTPTWGPIFSLRGRQDKNVAAAVSVFGRDTETRSVDLDVLYDRARWQARYKYQIFDVDNLDTGLTLDQTRHELRGTFSDRYWNDQISFFVDGLFSTTDQEEFFPAGTTVGEPVPARAGLYAVDTTPDLGSLTPAPDLIDTDRRTPARESALPGAPPIQIGGANTDRNLGLDLGFTRPVTRLEITVDAVSGPAVLWRVFQSNDNFTWEEVFGVTSRFDQAFLRYTLLFPETTNRYFKAINITPNSQADVKATELRALLDVTTLSRSEAESLRASTGVTIGPIEGVTGMFSFFYDSDQDFVGGLVGRETRTFTYDALLRVELSESSALTFSYRLGDFEQEQLPQVFRTEDLFSAAYDWTPLPTVDAVVRASRRIEKERGALVRQTDSIQARARTDLLPALRLISEVIYNDIDDPFSGFQQQSFRLQEMLESQVTQTWGLTGALGLEWFDFSAEVDLTQRTTLLLDTSWRATPFLSLRGSWSLRDEDRENGDVRTLDQRYGLSWAPGPKLSSSLFYQEFDSDQGNRTASTGAGLNYRLNRHFTLFASASRSTTDREPLPRNEITNVTTGFNLSF
jgi:hypothetical protein